MLLFATAGNATDFGDLTNCKGHNAFVANQIQYKSSWGNQVR